MDRAVFIHNTLRDFVSHLGFGVADDDVIVSNEEHVGDLPLRRKALAASGRTKDEAVGVLETLAIYHDEVV